MNVLKGRTRLIRSLQLALVLFTFCLDFGHGIELREYDIGFHPIYRIRQSLGVAISRLQTPPLHGYLAYQSVIDVLNENGFATFSKDKGPPADPARWDIFFKNSAEMDTALQKAKDVKVDPALPPQQLLGNELAYSDYVYASFRLFGSHFASLYYFYFLLLAVACSMFIIEFGRSSFLMFLLTTYLAGLFFLQDYAQSEGNQLATLANGRLFEALALLPAMHIFVVIWRRYLLELVTLLTVTSQAVLLVFLVDCRTTAMWEIAMIVAVALGKTLAVARSRRSTTTQQQDLSLLVGWPGVVVVFLLAAHLTVINHLADSRYAGENKYHLVWHEVLRGMLGSSLELQRDYLGKEIGIAYGDDQISYDAVMQDLTERNDLSSPIAVRSNGRIYIDPDRSNSEYERLARSLAIRMAVAHPLAVLDSVVQKFSEQMRLFNLGHAMAWSNIASAFVLSVLGGLLWLSAGGLSTTNSELQSGTVATIIVLVFAAVPVAIVPSNLSVGTLLSYLIAGVLELFSLIVLFGRILAEVIPLKQKRAS